MGKAKRFNEYDSNVSEKRKLVRSFGLERQKLSIGSSFRSGPLSPPIAVSTGAGAGTGTGTFSTASIAADQTANIAATDHVEFDTLDEDGGVILQTGAGQLDGIFELSGGKKYQLSAHLRPEFSGATGQLVIAWYDITNAAELGRRAIYETQTHASNNANQPVAEIIVTPSANITVEVRIIAVTALTALANEYCVANIFEIALGGTGSGGSGGGSGGVTFPITPTINDHGNVGTVTEDIDLSASTGHVHKLTLTGNPTLTFSNPPTSGTQMEFEIEFIQDATGNRSVTHPASVIETVSIAKTAETTTIVTYRTNDGGTGYHAIPALRGSISLSGVTGFANTALSNLVSPTLNTDLNFNTNDVTNLDRIRFTSDSGTPSSAGDPSIFLDSNSDMSLNLATGKQFQFDFQNVNKWTLDATQLTGANIILTNTLTINDSSSDPVSAVGSFSSNGADCKVFSGGSIRSFSDIGGKATTELDNLGTTAINANLLFDASTYNIGSNGTPAATVYSERFSIPTGGSFTATRNQIISDVNGMIFNTPTGDDYTWDFAASGSPVWTMNVNNLTGPNIILTNTLTINDSSSDPASAGIFTRNGADVKVHSGGGVINLSNAGEVFTWSADHDANGNDFILDADGDTKIENNVDDTFELFTGGAARFTVTNTGGIFSGALTTLGAFRADGATTLNGAVTIGDASGDAISIVGNTTVQNNITFGSTGVDTISYVGKIDTDVLLVGGQVFKSQNTTEIGYQVTNASLTVGSKGSIQMPNATTGVSTTIAALDTAFGDIVGCFGIIEISSTLTLFVKQNNGNWGSVALTFDAITS